MKSLQKRTRSNVSSVHSSATHSLVELVKFFSLFEKPEEWSHGAEIERAAADENGVVQNSGDFGEHCSDVFCAKWNLIFLSYYYFFLFFKYYF